MARFYGLSVLNDQATFRVPTTAPMFLKLLLSLVLTTAVSLIRPTPVFSFSFLSILKQVQMDFREFNRKCLESCLVGVDGSESILLDFECFANYEYSVHLTNPAHEILFLDLKPRENGRGLTHCLRQVPKKTSRILRFRDGLLLENKPTRAIF